MSFVIWDITPISACHRIHADFLLGLCFDPEDGGDMVLRNVGWFAEIKRRYISEDITLHNHRFENLKSYILFNVIQATLCSS
jgi:hypothetical protein